MKYSKGLKFLSNGDGTCIVSGISVCTDHDIVIPPVSTTGDRVTRIGAGAFYGCRDLTSITIPDDVESIGDRAFYYCSKMTGITIPNGVTSIGSSAFYNCTGLTSITIPDSVTSVGDFAFSGCTGLTSITIGNSVTSIGDYAFYKCNKLTSITIPDSVTSIGEDAFYDCSQLQYNEYDNGYYLGNANNPYVVLIKAKDTFATSCTIHEQTKVIYRYAFKDCSRMTSITIGNSVKSIESWAFSNCSNLTSIIIPNSVTSIGMSAFRDCRNLSSVTIPDSITSIGDYAFYNCSSLTSITIPDGVTSIGSSAFYNCSSLQYNEYDNAYYLGNASNPYVVLVKAKDTSITSCVIYEQTKVIVPSAFSGCTGLTSVTIPDSVTSIGDHVFSCCAQLKSPENNYKAFSIKNGKLKCRNKVYTVGEKSSCRGDLVPCENGIHYCTNIFDIFNYYSGEYGVDFVIGICDVSDENIGHYSDSKRCARWIIPKKILTRKEVVDIMNGKGIE